MHHLFITPVIAGAVTAGVIALSPSFSDPYEASFSSEEPVVERVEVEIVAAIQTPTEPQAAPFVQLGQSFAPETAYTQVASLRMPKRDSMTDMPFQRGDLVLATAPIADRARLSRSSGCCPRAQSWSRRASPRDRGLRLR